MLIIIIYWHNIYLLIYVSIGNRLKPGTLYTDIVIISVDANVLAYAIVPVTAYTDILTHNNKQMHVLTL